MGNQSQILGGGTAGLLSNAKEAVPIVTDGMLGNVLTGFASDVDGHRFELPTTSSGTLTYKNESDVTQWTKTPASINAAADQWFGAPMLDLTDDLMYVIAADVGINPARYYVASINPAGTVVAIGNDAPTSDFTSDPSWGLPGAGLYRSADGVGNLFLRRCTGPSIQQLEFNIGTGQIVGDTFTTLLDGLSADGECTYKTSDDLFVGKFNAQVYESASISIVKDSGNNNVTMRLPFDVGSPRLTNQSSSAVLMWNGYIAIASTDNVRPYVGGPRYLNKAKFDAAVKRLAQLGGVI